MSYMPGAPVSGWVVIFLGGATVKSWIIYAYVWLLRLVATLLNITISFGPPFHALSKLTYDPPYLLLYVAFHLCHVLVLVHFMIKLIVSLVRPHKWQCIIGGLRDLFPAFWFLLSWFCWLIWFPLFDVLFEALTIFSKAVILFLNSCTNSFNALFDSEKLADA